MSVAVQTHPTHRGDDFSRGLGILMFRNRSSTHALGTFILLFVMAWLAMAVAGVLMLHDQHELIVAMSVGWSHILHDLLGRDVGQWAVWTKGGWDKWPPSAILAEPYYRNIADAILRTCWWSLLVSTALAVPTAIGMHRRITRYGRRMIAGKYLRGAVKLEDRELATRIQKRRQASPLRIGRLPIPVTTECEHLAFIGSPGSGKTQEILQLLDRIRERGDAAVIYDSKGIFTAHYYAAERGDVLLNPLDARSRPWSPWAEIEDDMDADRVAHALIPAGDHSTPFWHDSARAMLSAALSKLQRQGQCDLARLLQLLLHAHEAEREAFFEGTDVAQIYDKGGERMRVSVEQNIRTYLRCLRHLPLESGGAEDFSILRHIRAIDTRERQPWLFLPSPLRAKHTSIKPLLTCWMDCAVAALLSCGEHRNRRCWFIMDEVKSLYHVPSLADLMAEGRGFGACIVLGFQDLSQLRKVYGADDAKTMSAVLGTKVLFKIADPETARWGADALGEVELEMVKESTRYDAGEQPSGVQLGSHRVQRHLVMPAELQRQERFRCWVQLSGAWPIAQTTIPDPRTVKRAPIASPIEFADPAKSYAAQIADMPDPPLQDAEDDDGTPNSVASKQARTTGFQASAPPPTAEGDRTEPAESADSDVPPVKLNSNKSDA